MSETWPSDKTVARAFKNEIAEVIFTPWGAGKGVRSANPAVYLVVGPKSLVFCETCQEREFTPDPPGSGAPGEPRNPLVAPGTKSHALFILTWLHKFSEAHRHEEPAEEPSDPSDN